MTFVKTLAYLSLHVLRVVLAIDVAAGCLALHRQRRVPNLDWQPVHQIQQARLAHVLHFGTGLADDGRLEPHPLAWIPPEDGERPVAGTAFPPILLLGLNHKEIDV